MTKEILTELISKGYSICKISKELKSTPSKIKRLLKKFGLKTSRLVKQNYCLFCNNHLKRNSKFCSNKCQGDFKTKLKYEKFLNGYYLNISSIKQIFKKYGKSECSICGIKDWCNKPLILIIDHIDGNSENNHISNLRQICSNCDSQLPTYKGRNIGNGREYRRIRYKEGRSY